MSMLFNWPSTVYRAHTYCRLYHASSVLPHLTEVPQWVHHFIFFILTIMTIINDININFEHIFLKQLYTYIIIPTCIATYTPGNVFSQSIYLKASRSLISVSWTHTCFPWLAWLETTPWAFLYNCFVIEIIDVYFAWGLNIVDYQQPGQNTKLRNLSGKIYRLPPPNNIFYIHHCFSNTVYIHIHDSFSYTGFCSSSVFNSCGTWLPITLQAWLQLYSYNYMCQQLQEGINIARGEGKCHVQPHPIVRTSRLIQTAYGLQ